MTKQWTGLETRSSNIFIFMNNQKLVSIIILAWNGKDVISQNLKSVLSNFDSEKCELIVVDNASTDNTVEIVKDLTKDLPEGCFKLIENKENLGFAKGNNVGIKEATGKYILLLNQDVEQKKDAILKMIEFLENDEANSGKKYGAVAPQLLFPNGEVQDFSCRPLYDWNVLLKDYLSFGRYRKKFYDHSKSQDVEQPMASVLMIRGDLLKELNGLDENENFWIYFNDVDLSYRIKQAGFNHYFLADVQFFHHHGESAAKMFPIDRLWKYHKGLHYYFLKNIIKNKVSVQYLFLLIISVASFLVTVLREMFRFLKAKIKGRQEDLIVEIKKAL